MSAPPLSPEKARETVEAVEQALREGIPWDGAGKGASARSEAAKRLGIAPQTLGHRLDSIERQIAAGFEGYRLPDLSAYRPRQYLHRPAGAPVIPFQDHIKEPDPDGEPLHIAVIGDAHDSPHLADKSRFYWLGRYIAERRIPWVVSMGDWWTLDSFSSHTDRGTLEGLAKPTFDQDRDSFHESQRAFQEGLGDWRPKKDVVLGNHELRAWRWDNLHPEAESHGHKILEAFAQWGWRTTPYGEFRFIGGVGFIHAPLQPASDKPYGGKTGGQRASNDTLFDVIRGDDHRHTVSVGDKIGPVRAPAVYSAATALPPGYIEGYARKGGSTWRSGICEAVIWGGHVRSWSFTEMVLLRRLYGERTAA
jgi:hypothetical protein